jgi:hypothetical protein
VRVASAAYQDGEGLGSGKHTVSGHTTGRFAHHRSLFLSHVPKNREKMI